MPDLPAPQINADGAAYWKAIAEQRLTVRKCQDCGHTHFMPRHLCPNCWSDKLEAIDASGRGRVHSFTIIRRASDPAFAHLCPYVVALIDLEEGPRMMSNILGDDALEVRIGDPVTVLFEERGEGTKVPQFRRAAA
jgi:uncharacterized protein